MHRGAHVVGKVTIGENVGIWYNTVVRGDMEEIIIGDNSNIQDNSMALGSQARVVRKLTESEIESNKKNAEEYVKLMKASKELN
ncbi:putative uncharacterized protein [Eubacterium sp. CAG:192]|nr:putative uncharacterized protein [Eubacterium sp. CAG:192]